MEFFYTRAFYQHNHLQIAEFYMDKSLIFWIHWLYSKSNDNTKGFLFLSFISLLAAGRLRGCSANAI